MNIKKQIQLIYTSAIFKTVTLTGVWVALLAARGFSLVQIGLAETVFHIASLIFEIPSGMMADIYGRKKMLIAGQVLGVVACTIMAISNGFTLVCVAMAFIAIGYNFESGSEEALIYDSLKSVGQQERYEKVSSNMLILYRLGGAVSTLCAGLSLFLGYRVAYSCSALMHVITLILLLGLVEAEFDAMPKSHLDEIENPILRITKKVVDYFKESIRFLVVHKKATAIMFVNSLVGAVDVLLLFFLQAKIPETGISEWILGLALFVMQLGGVVGARLILRVKKVRYWKIFLACAMGVVFGVCMEHTAMVVPMVLGGFISAMADDAIQVRTEAKLQDMFPSELRATLVSMNSFTYSVLMIVMSPLAGYFFSKW